MGMVMKTFRESAALWRQTQIIPQEGQGSRDKGEGRVRGVEVVSSKFPFFMALF
jgi:hypothetical protein